MSLHAAPPPASTTWFTNGITPPHWLYQGPVGSYVIEEIIGDVRMRFEAPSMEAVVMLAEAYWARDKARKDAEKTEKAEAIRAEKKCVDEKPAPSASVAWVADGRWWSELPVGTRFRHKVLGIEYEKIEPDTHYVANPSDATAYAKVRYVSGAARGEIASIFLSDLRGRCDVLPTVGNTESPRPEQKIPASKITDSELEAWWKTVRVGTVLDSIFVGASVIKHSEDTERLNGKVWCSVRVGGGLLPDMAGLRTLYRDFVVRPGS